MGGAPATNALPRAPTTTTTTPLQVGPALVEVSEEPHQDKLLPTLCRSCSPFSCSLDPHTGGLGPSREEAPNWKAHAAMGTSWTAEETERGRWLGSSVLWTVRSGETRHFSFGIDLIGSVFPLGSPEYLRGNVSLGDTERHGGTRGGRETTRRDGRKFLGEAWRTLGGGTMRLTPTKSLSSAALLILLLARWSDSRE